MSASVSNREGQEGTGRRSEHHFENRLVVGIGARFITSPESCLSFFGPLTMLDPSLIPVSILRLLPQTPAFKEHSQAVDAPSKEK